MTLPQKPRAEPGDPFPQLWERLDEYASELDTEVIAAAAGQPDRVFSPPVAVEPTAVGDRPAIDNAQLLEQVSLGSPVEEPLLPSEPAPATRATATMARLLENQGHGGEAEEIYREVLKRQPSNREAAEKLLERVRQAPWSLGARELLSAEASSAEDEPVSGAASGAELRRHLLGRYVNRLRHGGQ